jgi:DNA-binding beta-propeller fold protein YncE
MNGKRNLVTGATLLGLTVALGVGSCAMDNTAQAAAPGDVPLFEVDPFWPKPLPNHWLLSMTIGVEVDSRDHVWIVHRNTEDQYVARTEIGLVQDPPLSECCAPAPPILEFDPDGNLVQGWGGPSESGEFDWPTSNHGIAIDPMDNVWIGGNGGPDRQILKFARDGTFLAQYGESGAQNSSTSDVNFGRVAEIHVDAARSEAYLADGYLNRRVAVLDVETGAMKRFWGAYGNVPSDDPVPGYVPGETPPQQFRTPVHCAQLSNDDLLYVCDRPSNRISVFNPDGTFVTEKIIAPATLSQGSTWDIAFSHDPEQRFIYLADGQNMKVYVIERETLEILYSFGDGGRQPGLFFAVHSISVDSQGNIYTTETYQGRRVQKFTFMGYGPNPGGDMGAAWPANRRRGS